MEKTAGKPDLRSALFICACFLLTSTGYLAWVYHIMEMVPFRTADAVSMVAGYALQAAGLGLFMAFLRRRGGLRRRLFNLSLILHMLCLIPAVMSASLLWTMVFGGLLNLQCGMIAGCYLYTLTSWTGEENSAITLGTGYGISILLTWLLSVAVGGSAYYTRSILVVCLLLTVLAFCAAIPQPEQAAEADAGGGAGPDRLSGKAGMTEEEKNCILQSGLLILLFSIVNSCGFGFPSADLGQGVSLESSRLFYAAGLLIAGLANDQSRKHGAVCALAALVIPFIMLALKGESVPLRIFWALSYFTFGFYSIYRMILFSDIARRRNLMFLCGFGLLTGRIGDAAGEALCLALSDRMPILIGITALLFVVCVFLFFRIYPVLYLGQAHPQSLFQAHPQSLSQASGAGEEESGKSPDGPGSEYPGGQAPGTADGAADGAGSRTIKAPDYAGGRTIKAPDYAGGRTLGSSDHAGGRTLGSSDDAGNHALRASDDTDSQVPETVDKAGSQAPEAADKAGSQAPENSDDTGRQMPYEPGSGAPFDPVYEQRSAGAGGPGPEGERERFYRFCARYALSAREREVLRQLLEEKTNKEIAEILSISEGTVKYHIHNLLQKTECRNRGVLLSVFFVGRDHVSEHAASGKAEKNSEKQ